ncbi:MAG: D-alanyl-D-alanine dipeptidase [Prosthecobacter sp.]|nr:D-alanyl-D-alanine dipeptidase [Prosthecobacter sp.]
MLASGMALLASCAVTERRSAIQHGKMVEKASQYDLVDVRQAVPDIGVDLRYATAQNVTGHPLYPRHMPCLLRSMTVERLKQAQASLRAQGYGLRIWDAWRPPEAQEKLHAHGGSTGLFLDPRTGWSRHCGGVSLDATLVDAAGRELKMPTYFDENLEQAASARVDPDPAVRERLRILHAAMRRAGLIPLEGEWWHFDDQDHLHDPVPVVWGREVGVQID